MSINPVESSSPSVIPTTSPASGTWSTLKSSILQRIYSFASAEAAAVFPCVCKAWQTAISEQRKVADKASDRRVDCITIFASKDHRRDDELILNLRYISARALNKITFIEGTTSVGEIPSNHFYSLEELHSDDSTSLNPVARLVTFYRQIVRHDSWSLSGEELREGCSAALLETIIELYQDPHFRDIVLSESFKTYNPYDFGLDKAVPWKGPQLTSEQVSYLKALQAIFQKLDTDLPKVPLPEKHPYFLRALLVDCKELWSAPSMGATILPFIVECAAVTKTYRIGEKLKETAPFQVKMLFEIFYPMALRCDVLPSSLLLQLEPSMKKALEDTLLSAHQLNHRLKVMELDEALQVYHRSNFMARKVISKLSELDKRGDVSLKDHSVSIYLGSAHLPIVKSKLSAYTHRPIVVEDAETGAREVAMEAALLRQKDPEACISFVVKYDAPSGTTLSLRGEWPGVHWDKDIPLTQLKPGEWLVSIVGPPITSYKIVRNGKDWEIGDNHLAHDGLNEISPKFD